MSSPSVQVQHQPSSGAKTVTSPSAEPGPTSTKFDIVRCSRCQRSMSLENESTPGIVRFGMNSYYCSRCASMVGFIRWVRLWQRIMKCGKCYMIWSRKEQPGRVIRNRTLSLFTYKRSFDVVFLMPLLFAFRSTILLEYIGRLILCIISSRGLSRTPSIASPKVPASSHEKNYSPHCHHALVVRYSEHSDDTSFWRYGSQDDMPYVLTSRHWRRRVGSSLSALPTQPIRNVTSMKTMAEIEGVQLATPNWWIVIYPVYYSYFLCMATGVFLLFSLSLATCCHHHNTQKASFMLLYTLFPSLCFIRRLL